MTVKIKRIENGKIPEYKTDGSAGADCYARISREIIIEPGMSMTIPLGFAVEIPEGYEMQIRGRSGLARKNQIDCFIGTIDSDYRGEVSAILINKGSKYFSISPNDRIAQAVISPVKRAEWEEVGELSDTERGENGFGSTGVSEHKFYKPYASLIEAEMNLGKRVIIDESKCGEIKRMYNDGGNYLIIKLDDGSECEMLFTSAFQRVKIDGHRFGKEIEFE